MRTRSRVLVAAAASALLLTGCAGRLPADTAAIVAGERVEVGDLEILVAAQLSEGSLGRPSADEFRNADQLQRQTLAQLIQDTLVAAAAAELGVEASEAAIDEEFANLAEQYGGMEELRAEIARQSLRESDVRRQLSNFLRRDLLADHFVEQVTDEQVRAEYEARVEQEFRVVDLAHIQVGSEEEGRAIMEELQAGADFAELAAERSTDQTTAGDGGDLGELPRGQLPQEIDDPVWASEPGELVGPVQTQVGWHVIRVKEFRERPLDELRGQLRDELGGRAFRDWFQALLADADVRVAPRFGQWDPASGTVAPSGPLEAVEPAAPPPAPES
ncbi:MAG: foldase protein PrsA [Nitriliruptorales bacterium]